MSDTSVQRRSAIGIGVSALTVASPFVLLLIDLKRSLIASLSLDETLTYWAIKDGLFETIDRVIHYQGQSPFYFLLVWGFGQLLGWREWALRTPSVLFLLLSCWILYKIGQILYDQFSAKIAVSGFVAVWIFLGGSANARPYNLAILCCLASIWALLRWIETGKLSYRVLYILSSSAIVYAHILYAPAMLLHLLLWILYKPPGQRAGFGELLANWLVVALLISPNLYQFGLLAGKRGLYAHPPMPAWIDLMNAWFPRGLFHFWGVGFLLTFAFIPSTRFEKDRLLIRANVFSMFWWLAPATLVFLVSKLGGASFFGLWYYSWFAPGFGLAYAGIVATLQPVKSRATAGSVYLFCLLIAVSVKPASTEGWGEAAQFVNDQASKEETLFLWTGLIETGSDQWMSEESNRDYLLGPAHYYQFIPEKVVLLPLDFGSEKTQGLLAEPEKGSRAWLLVRSVILVSPADGSSLKSEEKCRQALKKSGIQVAASRSFGAVYAFELRL